MIPPGSLLWSGPSRCRFSSSPLLKLSNRSEGATQQLLLSGAVIHRVKLWYRQPKTAASQAGIEGVETSLTRTPLWFGQTIKILNIYSIFTYSHGLCYCNYYYFTLSITHLPKIMPVVLSCLFQKEQILAEMEEVCSGTLGKIKLSHSYFQVLNCHFQWLSTTCGCSGPLWRMAQFGFVTACPIHSLHKSSHQSLAGLLRSISPCLGQAATSRMKMKPKMKWQKSTLEAGTKSESILLPTANSLSWCLSSWQLYEAEFLYNSSHSKSCISEDVVTGGLCHSWLAAVCRSLTPAAMTD